MSFTKIQTVEELKQLALEVILDKTDSVTKVSQGSVLNAIAYSEGKLAQKILKEGALVESLLFPDSARGTQLDDIAKIRGISPRFLDTGSTTYVRLVGDVGTTYLKNVHTFTSTNGTIFDLEKDITMPSFGFTYAKVKSRTKGAVTNVEPFTLNKVVPIPTGHNYVVNEYYATGGRDEESDDIFRKRIKAYPNIVGTGTTSSLEQALMYINPRILKVFTGGKGENGKTILYILTVDGTDLSADELNEISDLLYKFTSITDLLPFGINTNYLGLELRNVSYFTLDISFRVDVDTKFDFDTTRKNIQIAFNKKYDYRYWAGTKNSKIEWDDLLQIAKNTKGIKYVYDNSFEINGFSRTDIPIPNNAFPRVRGFQILDKNGSIIVNFSGTLNPIFYPNQADFSFQSTYLSQI